MGQGAASPGVTPLRSPLLPPSPESDGGSHRRKEMEDWGVLGLGGIQWRGGRLFQGAELWEGVADSGVHLRLRMGSPRGKRAREPRREGERLWR